MIAQALGVLALPWLIALLSEELLFTNEATNNANALVFLVILLFAFLATAQIIGRIVLVGVSENIAAALRVAVFDHVQRLPLKFHLEHPRGDIVSIVWFETEQLKNFLTGPVLSTIPSITTVIGALILMLRLDFLLALPIAVGIPLCVLLAKLLGRHFRGLSDQWRTSQAETIALLERNLDILPATKSFAQESETVRQYKKRVDDLLSVAVKLQRRQAVLSPLFEFLVASAMIVILMVISGRVTSGIMDPEQFIAFILYAALLARPIGGLASLWGEYQTARGVLERLDRVMQSPLEQLSVGRKLTRALGDIRFEDVSFAYLESQPVLKSISLHIPAGQTVAITGENGAGKSTLIELLVRFFEPSTGKILLDGDEISSMQIESVRKSIALVPQKPLLFDGTVRENVLFGRPTASEAEIHHALAKAQATEFVDRLDDKLDTLIGDNGAKLSGGQGQRIALARALVKNSPILILDEPTAMFDPQGEAEFVKSVRSDFQDKTVILITHRPAALELVERIIELDAGRVNADSKSKLNPMAENL